MMSCRVRGVREARSHLAHVLANVARLVAGRVRELAAPLDDDVHLLALARLGAEGRLDLRFGAEEGDLVLDDLEQLLDLLLVALGHLERLLGRLGDVLEMLGLAQRYLVHAPLQQLDERLAPRHRALEVELELHCGRQCRRIETTHSSAFGRRDGRRTSST